MELAGNDLSIDDLNHSGNLRDGRKVAVMAEQLAKAASDWMNDGEETTVKLRAALARLEA
jgi:hypothetical protein